MQTKSFKHGNLSRSWAYKISEQALCPELEGMLFCEGGVYHQKVQEQAELWLQGGNNTLQDINSTFRSPAENGKEKMRSKRPVCMQYMTHRLE